MILDSHNAQQKNYSLPFKEVLSPAYLLTTYREPFDTYKGCDVQTTLTLRHSHFRECIELKTKLVDRADESQIGIALANLDISNEKIELADKDEVKEILIKVTRGTIISSYTNHKYEHNTKSPSQPRRLDDLPEATKTIMSTMTAPTILEFSGDDSEVSTTGLTLGCPEWAEAIRDRVLNDRCLMVLVDAGHQVQELEIVLRCMEKGKDPLERFCPPGVDTDTRYDISRIISNPMPQSLLGFNQTSGWKSLHEYTVAALAGGELDLAPELRKKRAYGKSLKTLVLINPYGDKKTYEFWGYITAPSGDEYRPQVDEMFEVRFQQNDRGSDILVWHACVLAEVGTDLQGMLPVQVFRGQHKDLPKSSAFEPNCINPAGLSAVDLHKKLQQDTGNSVRVKLTENDANYLKIRQAYVDLHRTVKASVRPYRSRIIQLLLGQRLDKLESKDLYQHIRTADFDPQKYMMPLNDRQTQVIYASRNIHGGVLSIQGPPGTGKTTMLDQLPLPFFAADGDHIELFVSPTNNGADHIARNLCIGAASLKKRSSKAKAKNPYVLRVHTETAEEEIHRTQGPKLEFGQNSKLNQSNVGNKDCATPPETMTKLVNEFKAAGESRFPGIRDKRVQATDYSLGYMKLLISGIVPNEDYQFADTERFAEYRAAYQKRKAGRRLDTEELSLLEDDGKELSRLAIKGASAIVSTTATISTADILDHVKDQVVAIFFDEAAFEREDNLMPIFAAHFSRDPCLVMIGDQQQLAPCTQAKVEENAFQPQLEISFMARMISLGMDYTMLTKQYRMVPQISNMVNKMTYEGRLIDDDCTQLSQRPLARKFQQFGQDNFGTSTNRVMINFPSSKANKTSQNAAGSKSNDFFVCAVAIIIEKLLAAFGTTASIAVLTPYAFQRKKYGVMRSSMQKQNLPNVDKLVIDTIGKAQGQQYDIVIVDLPVSDSIGFLKDEKRVNVVMSRARNGLIVVCDRSMIEQACRKTPGTYLTRVMPFFDGSTWSEEKNDTCPKNKFYTPGDKKPWVTRSKK